MGNKKSKAKEITNSNDKKKINPFFKHIAAYIIILFAAMLYFKPVAFEGKALGQHDNLQAKGLYTESQNYLDNGDRIFWTNQFFCGTPLNVSHNRSVNYTRSIWHIASLYQPYSNPWITLFVIMLFCYISLNLLGINFAVCIALSMIIGFFTANTLYISAGHTAKLHVLATTPLLISAMVIAYKRNLFLGASIFALTLGVNLMKNHVQITYYTFLGLFFIGLFFMFDAIKEKKLFYFWKFVAAIFIATILGISSNCGFLWPVYEYGEESTRGTTELTKKNHSNGLDKDYVFAFSYERWETLSTMFPNFYGGTQGKSFYNQEGSTKTALLFRDREVGKKLAAVAEKKLGSTNRAGKYLSQYRGSQSMCGGPIYYGVVVFFLLFLSLLLVRGSLKWAFISTFLLFVFLAWGRNFSFFNELMYDYFPFYSKFRDTKMTLLVGQPFVILMIGLGFKELINFDSSKYSDSWSAKLLPSLKQTVSKQGYVVLAGLITLGICVLTLIYSVLGSPSAISDSDISSIPSLVNALHVDRAALIQADAIRSIGFVFAAFAVLFFYARDTINIIVASIAIAFIACIDLGTINSDYLNENSYTDMNYVEKSENMTPTQADKDILARDQSYYRVADYSRGAPSQSADASFFHKSVGGYCAAKPQLYQELWTGYNMDNPQIALKRNINIFNMLNVKYVMVSQDQFMGNPTALGHAWFVEEVKMVENADEELEGLAGLATQTTALVQKKYQSYLKGLENKWSGSDRIYLESYHPDTMVYKTECTHERFAVFSEMFYPPSKGWTVYINDKEIEEGFIKTNFALRGMRIPTGNNTIKMVFAPKSMKLGNIIGRVTSALILLAFAFTLYLHFKNSNNEKT